MTHKITRHVEVAIIGAGTAGQTAFKKANKQTDDLVIINHGYWTTTCATVGCMPSKLLIAAADRAHIAKDSANFGIKTQVTIDGQQVMRRVQELRDFFTSHVEKQVEGWEDAKKIDGKAHITKQGLIAVNNELIKATQIIIATGSTPHIPDGWQDKLKDKLYTSDTIFELNDLPSSMAVVGTGAIGLELAQSFARLGVAVTLFNRTDVIGGIRDKKINQCAIDCIKNELTLALSSKIDDVGITDNKAHIDYMDKHGNTQHWQGDMVLAATGRRNTLKQLGVENLGVKLDDKHRPKDLNINTGQIGDSDVYIVGDANAHLPLLHVASDEGFSAGASVCPDKSGAFIRPPSPPISIIFCEPQIASVGKSQQQLDQEGEKYVIGCVDFSRQGRSRVMGVNCGLLHIYGCKQTDRILGASMVAPDAEYMAHILANAITNNLTVQQLLAAPFYHPTILEGLRTALRDVQQQMHIQHQAEFQE